MKGWRNLIAEGDNSQVISVVQNQLEEPQLSYGALVSKILFFFLLVFINFLVSLLSDPVWSKKKNTLQSSIHNYFSILKLSD